VRGSKGNKVLRTVKIALDYGYRNSVWKYFCDQTCMHEFFYKHYQEFIRLHPRREALETPIDVVVETRTNWHGQPYATKVIKEVVDNA
tara:strand:- start:19 stop:282 length:264 start_codon:yes stop_codon:yes gene_type:complete